MPQLLDFATSTGLSKITAGLRALAVGDGIETDNRGKSWKLDTVDTSAVGAVTTTTLAETSLGANGTAFPIADCPTHRAPIFSHPTTRDLYNCAPNASASTGLNVQRRSLGGVLLAANKLDAAASQYIDVQINLLSSGNILVSGSVSGVGVKHFVLDPNNLKTLFSVTGEIATVGVLDVIALSGGGFSASYLKSGTATSRLAIFNNDCTVAVAAFTTVTWTGTAGVVASRQVQNSDGNIGVAWASAYVTNGGGYHGIFSVLGATVLAPAQDSAILPVAASRLEIATLTGFWAYNYPCTGATGNKTFVFNNAGALQGAALTHGGTQVTGAFVTSLVADPDGLQFWLVDNNSGDAFLSVNLIPTSGAGNVSTYVGPAIIASSQQAVAAVYDRGKLCIARFDISADLTISYSCFDIINKVLELDNTQIGTAYATSQDIPFNIVASGDWTLVVLRSGVSAGMSIMGKKFAASAIIGGIFSAIAAGATGYARSGVNGGGGLAVAINTTPGSVSASFDMSAGAPHGNKGSVSRNQLSLVGM